MTDPHRLNDHGQPIGPALPHWTPRPRPPRTPVAGRYGALEPLAPRHAEALHDAWTAAPDDRDWTYLLGERPRGAAAWADHVAELAGRDDAVHHAVIDHATGRAVGTLALMRIEPAHGVIEVGHVAFSPRLQRTRLSTEAQYLLMRRVFDELGYRRYEWKCDALNAPSRAAALRYGFQFEGVFRQALVTKQRSRDTAWFSLLDHEWPAVRQAFEAWLSPDNFDAHGVQRTRLRTG